MLIPQMMVPGISTGHSTDPNTIQPANQGRKHTATLYEFKDVLSPVKTALLQKFFFWFKTFLSWCKPEVKC
jgi:hypothetical protein